MRCSGTSSVIRDARSRLATLQSLDMFLTARGLTLDSTVAAAATSSPFVTCFLHLRFASRVGRVFPTLKYHSENGPPRHHPRLAIVLRRRPFTRFHFRVSLCKTILGRRRAKTEVKQRSALRRRLKRERERERERGGGD